MLEDSLFRYKGAGCDMVVMWFSCGGGVLKGNGDFARGVRGRREIKGSSLLGRGFGELPAKFLGK